MDKPFIKPIADYLNALDIDALSEGQIFDILNGCYKAMNETPDFAEWFAIFDAKIRFEVRLVILRRQKTPIKGKSRL